jgi:hypothetical protein
VFFSSYASIIISRKLRKGRRHCQYYPRVYLDKCFLKFPLAIYHIKNH